MIRIKKNKIKAEEYANLILTSKGNYQSVSDKLDNWLLDNLHHPNRTVIKCLRTHIKDILIAEPIQLEKFVKDFKSKGYHTKIYNSSNKKLTTLGTVVKDLFNYDGFRKGKKAIWLAKELNIKSCTYCNSQYTLTVKHDGDTKLLFHLDHFYPKSVYPYLSLSYYNLIPCCASCNMSKSDKPYVLNDNIHPYEDSLDEIAKYEATKKSLLQFLLDVNLNDNKIELQLNLRKTFSGDKGMEKKLNNYKNEFKVESQYQQFKDIVGETYIKGLFYNSSRRKELIDLLNKHSGTTLTNDMINRFIVGNYTEDKDLLRRPLAKMMRDISEDIGLI